MADIETEENIDQESPDLSRPEVVDKYKASAEIANRVLLKVIENIQPGKKVVEICSFGDKLIEDSLTNLWTKFKRGVAFPTCISINNCVGHNSPLPNDNQIINDGDLVKIDLGVHIDGFISTTAHTMIAGQTGPEKVVTGRIADVVCAAYFAAECALRLLRPGKTNKDVTEIISKVSDIFKCKPLEGVLSHQMKRFVIDANKVIINKTDLENQVETITFETNEVYGLDIVMSTGEGKAKETESKTTVYKRAVDQNYSLKMKNSRYVYSEIVKRFGTLPFTLRALDEKRGRHGITELVKHDLVQPYPVLYEKQGEYVAHFKFTVLILPSATIKLNAFPLPYVNSTYSVDSNEEVKQVMAMSLKRNKKKKKKPEQGKPQQQQQQTQQSTTQKMDTS